MRYDTLDIPITDTDHTPLKPAINRALTYVQQVIRCSI